MQIHKQKEHKIINKKVNKDSQRTSNIIRAEKNEFINEIRIRKNYVTKISEIEGETPERDKKTIKNQDKIINKENNKENQEIFKTKELGNNKKDKKVINSKIIAEEIDFLNKISTTGKPLTNIIKSVRENPERDKKTIRKQKKSETK